MTLPRPYSESDDEAVVDGCIRGDVHAFEALVDRHGALAEVAMLRELDAPSDAHGYDPEPLLAAIEEHLRRGDHAALRAWSPRECTLRAWLAAVARQVARRHAQATPRRASLIAFFPTPAVLQMSDVQAEEAAAAVHELLERLPPTLGALARLRVRGMDREQIAAAVGLAQTSVVANLERIASRIGELDETDAALAVEAYRIVLGAADAAERTRAAVRTEDDAEFRRARAIAEATWRSVRGRVLAKPAPRSGMCLDDRQVAGFVDGTMRGALRARSEGHVGACARCVDEVAALSTDLRAVPVLRDASGLDRSLAIAAASLATTRFDAARRIAELVREGPARDLRAARDLERLASAAGALAGGKSARPRESSGLVRRGLPSDEEAPLVAFEALVDGDAHAAYRAIDEHTAREPVAARLRLIAAAAGEDLGGARAFAREALARPRVDPGMVEDAQAVAALDRFEATAPRALPREIVIERLRDLLPEVVRDAVARAARLPA